MSAGERDVTGAAASGRTIRVLVAEDSLFARSVLVKILETDPEIMVVGVARNGQEAVDLVRELRPDVVLMDIRMPVMDGFQATQLIMAENPTPILVISASVGSENLKISFNAIQAGALDIIEAARQLVGYRGGDQIVRRVAWSPRSARHLARLRPPSWTPAASAVPVRGRDRRFHGGLAPHPAGGAGSFQLRFHHPAHFGGLRSRLRQWLAPRSALEVRVAGDGSQVRAVSSISPRIAACSSCGASGRSRCVRSARTERAAITHDVGRGLA
jgi:CheY-like chemotaxis protein